MRLFMPHELNHQDIDPHFLSSNMNSSRPSSPNLSTNSKQLSPSPCPHSLESNDFFIPLIFLLLCLMENDENK